MVERSLRKALGARSRDVFWQFLAEAVTVSTAASLIGGACGLFAVKAVVAGVLPAQSAARIPPSEALRG